MSPSEESAYLKNGFTLQIASNGLHGFPHLIAMWYEVIDDIVQFTTYGKSQKVLNLRRDPHLTMMLESGTKYNELKGLVIEGSAEIVDDSAETFRVARIINQKYGNPLAAFEPGAPSPRTKRVVVRVTPIRTFSWDHTKLGGVH